MGMGHAPLMPPPHHSPQNNEHYGLDWRKDKRKCHEILFSNIVEPRGFLSECLFQVSLEEKILSL